MKERKMSELESCLLTEQDLAQVVGGLADTPEGPVYALAETPDGSVYAWGDTPEGPVY
jgi:hypothetical protein